MAHFRKLCSECEVIVEECPCPAEQKMLILLVCIKCAKQGLPIKKALRVVEHLPPELETKFAQN